MLSQKKPANDLSARRYGNEEVLEKIRDSNTHLQKQVTELKNKYKLIKSRPPKGQVLTKPADLLEYNDVTVTRVLARRFEGHFNEDNYRKCIYDLQVALLSFSVLLVVVCSGWLVISNTNFLANGDFVYNAGLLGGFLMLCSLCYALMKRIRFINTLGHNETWYYAHLLCGIAGPLLIIFHTEFQVKSINSAVAFFTMFIIMIAGMFGRYIFTLLSYRAHLTYLAIGEIELALLSSLQQHQCTTARSSKKALKDLMVSGLKKPGFWLENFWQAVKILFSATHCYLVYRRDFRRTFRDISKQQQWDKPTTRATMKSNKHLIRRYVANMALLSLLTIVQNILINWRTIHANLLYLLALTATGHIVAVHMY